MGSGSFVWLRSKRVKSFKNSKVKKNYKIYTILQKL